MHADDILIVKGAEIGPFLTRREGEPIDKVRIAYLSHASGESSLPQPIFLRLPDCPQDRVIALPAYL
jgi:N-[(2S)-2-amino-2-carboxyethyl]-L-glutamate dehydrogenase